MLVRFLNALALLLLMLGSVLLYKAVDRGTELTNGYRLWSAFAGNFSIVGPYGGIVADEPDLEVPTAGEGMLVAVVGDIIAGNMSGGRPPVPNRYFVLDTRNRQLRENLSESDYRRVLRELGVAEPPKLRYPSGLARFGVLAPLREAVLVALWVATVVSLLGLPIYYAVCRLRRRPVPAALAEYAWALPGALFVLATLAMLVI